MNSKKIEKSKCCEDEVKPFTKYSIINAAASIIKHFTSSTYNAFSSDEIKTFRINQCENCEKMRLFFGKKQCSICNCFIESKASLIDQECPHPEINKWNYDNTD